MAVPRARGAADRRLPRDERPLLPGPHRPDVAPRDSDGNLAFATSFRIYETLFALPALVLSVALPVLAAAEADRERLRYQIQRMVEVGLFSPPILVLMVIILAKPLIVLLWGKQYLGAVPLVRIQGIALLAVFLGLVCPCSVRADRDPQAGRRPPRPRTALRSQS